MRSLVPILVLACLLAGMPASAQTYRWVDADGRVQYSSSPPPLQAVPDDLPRPEIGVTGPVPLTLRGRAHRGYTVEVRNRSRYPEALFIPAPGGERCGRAHASRIWVEIFTAEGKRLQGFCSVRAEDLGALPFSLPDPGARPAGVYIVMTDRVADRAYRSAVAALP